jgi:CubicO group peptidase (beta-lactamase class C family)
MPRLISSCCLLLGFVLLGPCHARGQTDKPDHLITADELGALLEKVRAQHDVPALAAGIVRKGDKPLVAVVGVRKRGMDDAATAADQWHLGSNTKPMTALLVALLIDRELLDWDTPLEEIFPDQAEKWNADVKKITPAQLLTHTSGLPSIGPLQGFLLVRSEGTAGEDRERIIQSLDKVKLSAKPGEKYEYSNLGYVVLGAILDKRGKAAWEEQLEKKLFQPLGIKEWGLGPFAKKDGLVGPWPHQTSGKPVAADGVLDNPQVMNSAGRVRLSVADYNRLLAEMLKLARGEKGLLKPAIAQKLFTNPYPASPHSLSGWLGFRKEPDAKGLILSHDGSNTFNYCTAVLVPDKNLALCVLTNQGGPGGPGAKACQDVRKELQGPK